MADSRSLREDITKEVVIAPFQWTGFLVMATTGCQRRGVGRAKIVASLAAYFLPDSACVH